MSIRKPRIRHLQFPSRKGGIFRPGKVIKGLRGGVHGYAAQGSPKIDAARAEKGPLRTETTAVNQKFPSCFQDVSMAKKKINDDRLLQLIRDGNSPAGAPRFFVGGKLRKCSAREDKTRHQLQPSCQSLNPSIPQSLNPSIPAASQKIGRELEAFYARSERSPRTRNEVRVHPSIPQSPNPHIFFPLLVAASIAASGCRFSLPFCRSKSSRGIILSN